MDEGSAHFSSPALLLVVVVPSTAQQEHFTEIHRVYRTYLDFYRQASPSRAPSRG